MALKWRSAKVSATQMAKLLIIRQMGVLGYFDADGKGDTLADDALDFPVATQREREAVQEALHRQMGRVEKFLGEAALERHIIQQRRK